MTRAFLARRATVYIDQGASIVVMTATTAIQ
jgi:hypothetical protein